MAYYGREDCEHVWRHRKDGWVEECVPAVCIECGAFGCLHDFIKEDIPEDIFFSEGQDGDANINGSWINPYVKKKEVSAYRERIKELDCKNNKMFQELFNLGIKIFSLDDDYVARKLDVSRSTIERWKNKETAPVYTIRKTILKRLVELEM